MRIYLVIVLLQFITAPKAKDTKRVKSKGCSSKKRLSVSKYKGKEKNSSKEVDLEEGLSIRTKKKPKSSKKSSTEDNTENKKEGKTKEKKKSAKKKSKKKKTKKREGASKEFRSEKIDVIDTKSKDFNPNPSEISPAINQNARLVSSESPSSYTQTTLPSKTIFGTQVTKTPIITTSTQHINSSPSTTVSTSIDKNTLPVTQTTNSIITKPETKPTNTIASSTNSSNNVKNLPVTQTTHSTVTHPTYRLTFKPNSSQAPQSVSKPNILTSTDPRTKTFTQQNNLSAPLTSVPRKTSSNKSSRSPVAKNMPKIEKDNPSFSYQKQVQLLTPEEEAELKRRRMNRALAKMLKRKIIQRQILPF